MLILNRMSFVPNEAQQKMPSRAAVASSAAPSATTEDAAFLVALGRRVRQAREQRGLARRALAREADVSERYLSQLEAGEGKTSIMLLRRIATALGVSLVELLGGEPSVERRLIQRFLLRLPSHRLEDVIFRLMREFGQEETARRQRIALIGLRGAGKTTLGSLLAQKIDVPFVELGREIEREAGMQLNEIFMLYGQRGYRRIERACLEKAIAEHERAVIAAGGGIVSELETFNLLLLNCFTVWIKTSPREHMSRVIAQGDLRPMRGNEEALQDLEKILASREPLYRKADAVVDTSGRNPDESLMLLHQATAA